jgi:hypothetical protein
LMPVLGNDSFKIMIDFEFISVKSCLL